MAKYKNKNTSIVFINIRRTFGNNLLTTIKRAVNSRKIHSIICRCFFNELIHREVIAEMLSSSTVVPHNGRSPLKISKI